MEYDASVLIRVARTDDGLELAALAVEIVERNSRATVRDFLRSIVSQCASMIRESPGGVFGPSATVEEAAPPIRAAVRALVAAMNGEYESSDAHLDVVLANSTTFEVAAVLALVTSWFVQLEARYRSHSAAFES